MNCVGVCVCVSARLPYCLGKDDIVECLFSIRIFHFLRFYEF